MSKNKLGTHIKLEPLFNLVQLGSTGSRTMTLYAAYKGFITDPRPDNIFVHMDIPSVRRHGDKNR